ncbi:MAG TPA: hypothetical protein VIM70_01625 [Clostridium sp.]|uniref:hypothetical protein n=1 Tax=Clostridium sp. TaxID=1506 RepID=UPI002F94956F
MIRFDKVKLSYTCYAFPPSGIHMDKVYHIVKKEDKLYFTDGVLEFEGEEDYIKMLFTPKNIKWEDVEFADEVKIEKKTIDIKIKK